MRQQRLRAAMHGFYRRQWRRSLHSPLPQYILHPSPPFLSLSLCIYQLRFLEAHSDNRVVMVVRDKGASRQTITDGSYVCQCA